jgi:hypothetical protein
MATRQNHLAQEPNAVTKQSAESAKRARRMSLAAGPNGTRAISSPWSQVGPEEGDNRVPQGAINPGPDEKWHLHHRRG